MNLKDKSLREILEELFPTPQEAKCIKIRGDRINQALSAIQAHYKKRRLSVPQKKEEETVILREQEATILHEYEDLLDSDKTPRIRAFLIKEKMCSPKMIRLLKSVKWYKGYGSSGHHSASLKWEYCQGKEC